MNNVSIIGRLGRDPEMKYLQDGKPVTSFSVALDEGRDKEPSWVDVTCWEKTAENVAQYLHAGDECAITGRLRQERWEKDGEKRSKLTVVASRVDFLRKKGESANGGGESAIPKSRAEAERTQGPVGENEDPFGPDA